MSTKLNVRYRKTDNKKRRPKVAPTVYHFHIIVIIHAVGWNFKFINFYLQAKV